jgi:hypothetical protein
MTFMTQPALRSVGKLAKIAGAALVAFAALFAIVRGFDYYVDQKMERLLSDESFLRKVSSKVRPSLIFDQKGSILVDQGALELIEKIELPENHGGLPSKVVVTPKKFLSHAPLLTPLDPYVIDARASRGSGLEWQYQIAYTGVGVDVNFSQCRFRLEVLY